MLFANHVTRSLIYTKAGKNQAAKLKIRQKSTPELEKIIKCGRFCPMNRIFFKYFPALILLFTGCFSRLGGEVLYSDKGTKVRYAGKFSGAPVTLPGSYHARRSDMRGIWVATVENLDFGVNASAAGFQQEFRRMADNLKKRNFNAVFFQIRPGCDAFYPSKYNVYSRYLCGHEGIGFRNFDPLRFMTGECEKRNIAFHAWLNPYRVAGHTKLSKQAYLKTLSPGNFARRHPEAVLCVRLKSGENMLFLDPGSPLVMQHLLDTVREVAQNYRVSSIHFDDYFYPYDQLPPEVDRASYQRYNPGRMPLAEWRRNNVNELIRLVGQEVRRISLKKSSRIEFGVSPFGIWANRKSTPAGSLTGGKESYSVLYADSRLWVKKKYIDYIVPQLYWPFEHQTAAYAALADWWAQTVRGTGVKLYIGQGIYRLGHNFGSRNELYNQLRYNSLHPEITGTVWFRYRFAVSPDNPVMRREISRITSECW